MWTSMMQKGKAIAAYGLLAMTVWQLFEIPHYIAAAQESELFSRQQPQEKPHQQAFQPH